MKERRKSHRISSELYRQTGRESAVSSRSTASSASGKFAKMLLKYADNEKETSEPPRRHQTLPELLTIINSNTSPVTMTPSSTTPSTATTWVAVSPSESEGKTPTSKSSKLRKPSLFFPRKNSEEDPKQVKYQEMMNVFNEKLKNI